MIVSNKHPRLQDVKTFIFPFMFELIKTGTLQSQLILSLLSHHPNNYNDIDDLLYGHGMPESLIISAH